ncbi:hypothetical protein AHMF7605_16955 [Adhaeribacter arboris]|uniref:Uncharacterized protein n=1 Tax=Adhaeribacter arboris TaxID=2072846 RepID=A0A2T2YHU4_9BACT|nr:hypothetical protein [Adhaeribacter arboris]PSR55070.1 hypothetical protein AHMF7605_16955 [Adhaeribacter arboris]
MKKLSKIIKLAGIVCLIVLASMGVGLGGAAPILPKNRARFIETAVKTELIEVKKDNATLTESTAEIKN